MRVILLGYWRSDAEPELPDPSDWVDERWSAEERDLVASYLEDGMRVRAFMGPSRCRICGAENGSQELSDGTYLWPEGLAHYLRVHQVRLPQAFVDHVNHSLDAIESMTVDRAWWREQGPPKG